MSRNPFGSEAVPRNLDNEDTFAQWFRVADNGAHPGVPVPRSEHPEFVLIVQSITSPTRRLQLRTLL